MRISRNAPAAALDAPPKSAYFYIPTTRILGALKDPEASLLNRRGLESPIKTICSRAFRRAGIKVDGSLSLPLSRLLLRLNPVNYCSTRVWTARGANTYILDNWRTRQWAIVRRPTLNLIRRPLCDLKTVAACIIESRCGNNFEEAVNVR